LLIISAPTILPLLFCALTLFGALTFLDLTLLLLTSLGFGLTLLVFAAPLVLTLLRFTLTVSALLFSLSLPLPPGFLSLLFLLLSLLILFLSSLLIFGAMLFTALWPRGLRPLFIFLPSLVSSAPLGICCCAQAKQ